MGPRGNGHRVRNSFRVAQVKAHFYTQGFKANPGLEFANAFSVSLCQNFERISWEGDPMDYDFRLLEDLADEPIAQGFGYGF